MNDDILRRIRAHLGEAVSIEAKQAWRRSHDQEPVSRLENSIENVRREAVFRRERLTEVVGCGLPWVESNRGPCRYQQGNRAQTDTSRR